MPAETMTLPYPNKVFRAFDQAVEIVASADTFNKDKNETMPNTINTIAAISSPQGGMLSNKESQNSGFIV
jgi:hypothetical protein